MLWSSGISRKSGALIVRYSQKKEYISFVFYCFENLSIVLTLEPLVRFRWDFQQNVPHWVTFKLNQMGTSTKQKTENLTRSTSDWFPKITSQIYNEVFYAFSMILQQWQCQHKQKNKVNKYGARHLQFSVVSGARL